MCAYVMQEREAKVPARHSPQLAWGPKHCHCVHGVLLLSVLFDYCPFANTLALRLVTKPAAGGQDLSEML